MAAEGIEGRATIQIQAPPEKVYAMLSDVTRMGEWSPECVKAEWVEGATGPASGARFKGSNKKGILRWSTKPTVKVAEPGQPERCENLADLVGDSRSAAMSRRP